MNRWYINKFYYIVFVDGFINVCRGAYKYIETKGIDKFNDALVNGTKGFTERFRNTHTGVLNYNMIGVLIGLIVLISALTVLLLI